MNTWPKQSECVEFYGQPGNNARTGFAVKWYHDNIVSVKIPWIMTDGKNHFGFIPIHRKCAPSLARVLAAVWERCDKSANRIHSERYDVFSGSLCYRPMRTGRALSMHAYGCAIDFDAPENALHAQKHEFTHDEILFQEFRREGWICGIDWRGNSVDAMHVQAAIVG